MRKQAKEVKKMNDMYIVRTILRFFSEVLILIFASLFIVNLLYELSIFRKLTNIIRPLAKILKIPEPYMACISMAMISPTVGYTMLLRIKEEHELKDEDIFPILLLISPVTQLCDTLRFGFPIALSVLGPIGGLIYLGFGLFRSITRMIIHGLYVSKKRKIIPIREEDNKKVERKRIQDAVKISLRKTLKMFKRIAVRFGIVTSIVILLLIFHVFDMIGSLIRPFLSMFGFNTYMMSVVMIQIFHFLTALYLAGTFYSQGLLTLKQVFVTIFTGNLIAIPLVHFRHYLPYRASLFGFKVALRWTLFDLCTSMFTNIIALLIAIYVL
ncbi:MAG: hypothetical protein GXO26_06100 [Crenarchaeota archaeon]|nr:hypothetical protein [Thermoproteota archaeon]